jgi:hypothetical protein
MHIRHLARHFILAMTALPVACASPSHSATGSPVARSPPPRTTTDTGIEEGLAFQLIVRRAVANSDSATGESYTNLNAAQSGGSWAFVGCVSSVAGSCFATQRTFLDERQQRELAKLLEAVTAMPGAGVTEGGCYHAVRNAGTYQVNDYLLSVGQDSYAGSIAHAGAACAPLALARWSVANGGLQVW